jgi:hypothetical protein
MINEELINKFRDAVNANDYVLFKYRKNQNRNQWNCICSAMDWITVAVEYISKATHKKSNSIEVFAYISSIDIVVESVQQLHRVLCNTSKVIYSDANDIFYDNQFGQTDLVYFKTIRACFGAHPVNLSDPSDTQNLSKKRFACWSGSNFGKGDFSVILYSNQLDGKNIFLDISFNQLDAFLNKYYSYLEILIEEIKRQYVEICLKMENLKFSCEGTPLAKLNILKEECRSRLNNDYYRSTIDELYLLFETPVTCKSNVRLVTQYQKALIRLIDEISNNLQSMKLVDLRNDYLLSPTPKGLQNGWGYWYGKLFESISGSGYLSLLWLDKIEELFQGHFIFQYDSYKELFLLVNAALYEAL